MKPLRPLHPRRAAENKAWWKIKSKEYPFHAEAPTAIRPEWVDASVGAVAGKPGIVSAPLRTGWRTYGFKTAEQRDDFLMRYPVASKVGNV